MIFGRKKISAIDRRLHELRREIARVGTEIKTLTRYQNAAGLSGLKTAKTYLTGPDSAMKGGAAAAISSAEDQSRPAGPDDLFAGEQENRKINSFFAADAADKGEMPLFESHSPLSTGGREKFANYFMAGHFPNLRPLRQEKRIIKNKAIVMVILVVLALIWLLFFLYD